MKVTLFLTIYEDSKPPKDSDALCDLITVTNNAIYRNDCDLLFGNNKTYEVDDDFFVNLLNIPLDDDMIISNFISSLENNNLSPDIFNLKQSGVVGYVPPETPDRVMSMSKDEIINLFDWYDFRDEIGHKLTMCVDFQCLIERLFGE